MIDAIIQGDERLPILVCVPGIFGLPEDFTALSRGWNDRFCSVFLDLHPHNREHGLSHESLSEVRFDRSADDIRDFLVERFPGRTFYFVGVSLGGKIILDFSAKFPEFYAGGVVTDVGPGPLEDSPLYKFTMELIPTVKLDQDWDHLKKELRQKFSVNIIRVFVQTQIQYAPGSQTATWKPGMKGLQDMLGHQRIRDQWMDVDNMKGPTTILKAENLSGISDVDYERLKKLPQFRLDFVPGGAHFLHLTHPERVQGDVLKLLAATTISP